MASSSSSSEGDCSARRLLPRISANQVRESGERLAERISAPLAYVRTDLVHGAIFEYENVHPPLTISRALAQLFALARQRSALPSKVATLWSAWNFWQFWQLAAAPVPMATPTTPPAAVSQWTAAQAPQNACLHHIIVPILIPSPPSPISILPSPHMHTCTVWSICWRRPWTNEGPPID